uniref:Reverse transcriptase domain-containing protein n=1 Tax=Tanacetum cinerariifolium TaxID=118510 RepID=A0A699GTK1_TANCI|nr:reverse transcriptase domain-containing protein [Tanacetum cinerariifolium]
MAMTADETTDSESDTVEPPFEKITINTNYKIKTSIEEPPTNLKLKPLPDNLEYVFLEEPSFLPKTTDIPGIFLSFCKHKIKLLDYKKPVVQKQRRLNPNIQEVVKKEIVKLLDTGIIYPIADNPWVSPIHCVPKKGGITVVTNENDELVPTRTVIGWRLCIDYRKLNEAIAKDHFSLPFMNQMRMPFSLCNAFATFQRCMLEIFHDMIEESVEGFSSCPKLGKMSLHGQRRNCAWTQEIKNRKGIENVTADHLSQIENDESSDDSEVDDNFLGETLMKINTKDKPWFADFANYLVGDVIPKGMMYQQKNKIFSDLKQYFWEEPYLFKAEVQALLIKDSRVVVTFLKRLFCRFGIPKALITDRCTHLCNKIMERTMKRYGVNHHFSTSYHPQTSGQVENTNRALKSILEKTVKDNLAIWSRKLDDAMWAFRTAYKTPIGTTP